MKKYVLQMQTFIGGIPWEHHFEMASDKMAIEYTQKILKNAGLPNSTRSVILWDNEDFVKEFRIETITEVVEVKQRD